MVEFSNSSQTRGAARKSLHAFKRTPAYQSLLREAIRKADEREPHATGTEKRRLRLERLEASLELERLAAGEKLDEYSGLLSMPDPLRGD
jgi:hypothetical protein